MKSYRDEAIVLRTHKLGEADRIITLLTAEHGQVRAVAKGVRKTTSKFGARVEPFSVIDAQLYIGRTLDTLTQVTSIAQYGDAIAADYDLYLAATVVVETAERLLPMRTTAPTPNTCCSSVPSTRSPEAGTTPLSSVPPTRCEPSPWRAGRRPASTALYAARRGRTGRSRSPTAAPSATPAARPAHPPRHPTPSHSSANSSAATGCARTAARPTRAPRPRASSPPILNGISRGACAR